MPSNFKNKYIMKSPEKIKKTLKGNETFHT